MLTKGVKMVTSVQNHQRRYLVETFTSFMEIWTMLIENQLISDLTKTKNVLWFALTWLVEVLILKTWDGWFTMTKVVK